MNRAPVIDVHTHMLTKEWLALLESHGGPHYSLKPVAGGLRAIHLDGSPFMTPVPNMFDWEARIANMDKARVDVAITSLTCPNTFWGSPEVSLKAARIMNVPILATEQYPKGLGPTVREIRDVLPSYEPIEKMAFGCCGEPRFMNALSSAEKKKVILAGMETHVCVLQTALGLLREGCAVHVVSDAVCSRTEENYRTGIAFMSNQHSQIIHTSRQVSVNLNK